MYGLSYAVIHVQVVISPLGQAGAHQVGCERLCSPAVFFLSLGITISSGIIFILGQ